MSSPTIERARLDGTDRRIVIDKDIRMPVSLTVDDQTRTLYWIDDREGIHYSVESSDLDGTTNSRKSILTDTFHQPNKLTVSKDSLYWVDLGYHAVWKFPKAGGTESDLKQVFEFDGRNPFDIVANYQIEQPSEVAPECEKLAVMAQNNTARNEQLNGISKKEILLGEVSDGNSTCNCTPGFRQRCEVTLCHNYCLNGDCMLTSEGQPVCR